MIAVLNIRTEPQYRRGAFEAGLKRTGYTLKDRHTPTCKEDLLVLWNYHPATIQLAADWELSGGTVLVCENGYAGKDELGRQYYAIAVHGHNGSGWFPVGNEDRFSRLGIELQDWDNSGEYVLICGQRGIGSKHMASPPNWHTAIARQLDKTGVKQKVRTHPGNNFPPPVRLEDDLTDAWACCIWSSSAGIRALTLGKPVFYDAPYWICQESASKYENLLMNGQDGAVIDSTKRMHAMHKMSWGQRSVAEIETGEPFATIIENLGQAKW